MARGGSAGQQFGMSGGQKNVWKHRGLVIVQRCVLKSIVKNIIILELIMNTCQRIVSDYLGVSGSLVRDKIKCDRYVIWVSPALLPLLDRSEELLYTNVYPDPFLESYRMRGEYQSC
jgi:hypothetical protein